MHSRAARLARGWAAAGFSTFVAALSHTAAGGVEPSVFGVAASLLLAGSACTLLAGRRMSTWRLAIAVAISQALFHGVFATMGTPVAAGHAHAAAMDATAGAAHGDMLLAHLAAGLVTLVALRHAEVVLRELAGTARLLLARLLPILVPTVPSVPRLAPTTRVAAPATTLLLSPMRRRGPPTGFAAA